MGKRGPIAAILDAAGSSIEKIASATVILADEDDFTDKTKGLTRTSPACHECLLLLVRRGLRGSRCSHGRIIERIGQEPADCLRHLN